MIQLPQGCIGSCVTLLLGMSSLATTARAQVSDSFCGKIPFAQQSIVFRMQQGLEDNLFVRRESDPDLMSRDEVRVWLDAALGRISAARYRQRTLLSSTETCVPGDVDCITTEAPGSAQCAFSGSTCTSHSNCSSGVCNPVTNRCFPSQCDANNLCPAGGICLSNGFCSGISNGTIAAAGCSVFGCTLKLCPEAHPPGTSASSARVFALAHEFGHIQGLNHVDDEDQGNSCPCSLGLRESCSTTDGCHQEMMCSLANCMLGPPLIGDAEGLRMNYGGSPSTPTRALTTVRIADTGSGSIPNPVFNDIFFGANDVATFPGRIDCASTSGVQNDCAMVQRNATSNPVLLTRMSDSSGTAGAQWIQTPIAQLGINTLYMPDVAVSHDGTRAFVVVARGTMDAQVFLHEFNLDTGALIQSISLDGATDATGIATRAVAVLPPRVVWSRVLDAPVVAVYGPATTSACDGPGPDKFRLFRVNTSNGAVLAFPPLNTDSASAEPTATDSDFAHLQSNIHGDFDLECARSLSSGRQPIATETCVLSGAFAQLSQPAAPLSVIPFSMRPGVGQAVTLSVSVRSIVDVETAGVTAVELGTNASTGNYDASKASYVVMARPFGAGQTSNSRIMRGLGTSFTNSSTVRLFTSDEGTCVTQSHHGVTMPGHTPRMAPSLAWCHDCGTLEGTSLRAPSDGFCH